MSSTADSDFSAAEGWRLGDHALLASITARETELRLVEAAQLADLMEAETCGLHISLGFRSLLDLLCAQFTISRSEAKKRTERVRALRSGVYPAVADALAVGEISGGHLDELFRFHDKLSAAVDPAAWTEAEPALVDAAKAVDPSALRRFLERQVAPRLDPDGCQPKEKELAEPANRLAFDWRTKRVVALRR